MDFEQPPQEISDDQMRSKLEELGVPENMLDWTVAKISPEHRPNFFAIDLTVEELLDAIEKSQSHYDF